MAKKVKEPKILTDEELILEKENTAKKLLLENFIPSPPASRTFKVGDIITYGTHPNAVIVGVYEQGRIYEIKLWGEYFSYGKSIGQQESFQFVDWTSVLPLESRHMKSDLSKNQDIRLNYSQMSLDSMLGCYYSFGIDMNPSYQRDFVWTLEDNVALIDSIFNNRSIGTYILCHNGYGMGYGVPGYEVLDGKQRIKAITDFFEDKFKYEGFLYTELSPKDRNLFENVVFPRAEIKNATLEQKIKIFIHVNTTGNHMSPEHLERVKGMLK